MRLRIEFIYTGNRWRFSQGDLRRRAIQGSSYSLLYADSRAIAIVSALAIGLTTLFTTLFNTEMLEVGPKRFIILSRDSGPIRIILYQQISKTSLSVLQRPANKTGFLLPERFSFRTLDSRSNITPSRQPLAGLVSEQVAILATSATDLGLELTQLEHQIGH